MTDIEAAYHYAAAFIDYNPETGELTWRRRDGDDPSTRSWNTRYAEKGAGAIDNHGYLYVSVRPRGGPVYKIRAHRLAWFIVYGALPCGEIDHINGARADNRLANLREVTPQQNRRNARLRQNSTSGTQGVYWNRRLQRWIAQVGIDGGTRYLGCYQNKEDAIAVAQRARLNLGFTPRHCGLTENA